MKPVVLALLFVGLLSCRTDSRSTATEPAIQQIAEDGELRFSVSADRNEISAADVIELTLQVEYPEGAALGLPLVAQQLGEFLVESHATTPPRMVSPGRLAIKQKLTLAPLVVGDLSIPPLQVRATLDDGRTLLVQLSEIPIVVASLLDDTVDAGQQLRDIEEPLDPPIPTSWKLGTLAAALLAVGAFIWWRRRSIQRTTAPEPVPTVPPGEAAIARLDALSQSGLLDSGQHKQLYFELSAILREYIERRFSIQAQEQTTSEFFEALRTHNVFTQPQQSLLREFLFRADLIKFAELAATPQQCLEATESCRAFIVETAASGTRSVPEMRTVQP